MASDLEAEDAADVEKARELFKQVKGAIEGVLHGEAGDLFLEWLALVTHAHRTTFHANERLHCFREGKRSVFYEITKFLDLTPEQLVALRSRRILR